MIVASSDGLDRRGQRQSLSLLKLLPLIAAGVALFGCRSGLHPDAGTWVPRVVPSSLFSSSDGSKAAFICRVPAKRPDEWFSYRYLVVDLERGTLLSSSRPGGPIWDSILGWSGQRQAFAVIRESPLSSRSCAHVRTKLAIVTVSVRGDETTVFAWPRDIPDDELSDGYVRLFRASTGQHAVLFAENVGASGNLEEQQQRVGVVDLDTGRQTPLALLPPGWRCEAMVDQSENGQVRGLLVVAAKGAGPRLETALLSVDKGRAERMSVPLPRETLVPTFSPQGSTLAFLVRRKDERYDVRLVRVAQGAAGTRTVLTLRYRLVPRWAPDGRAVLLQRVRYPESLTALGGIADALARGVQSWWIVDTVTGEATKINPAWKTIEAVQWEGRSRSLLVVGDGALWRWNPNDSTSQYVMALPATG